MGIENRLTAGEGGGNWMRRVKGLSPPQKRKIPEHRQQDNNCQKEGAVQSSGDGRRLDLG